MATQLRTIRPAPPVPRAWQRGHNELERRPPERVPEPKQLYSAIVVTFMVHVPRTVGGDCDQCDGAWPCEPLRLAYRLREGF